MPKHLYLLRHADSVDKQPRELDKDRELSPTGFKDSIQIGGFLSQEKISLDMIYTSCAVRALATTQLVADAMKFLPEKVKPEDELYDASVRTFFEFVTRLDDAYSRVMCVGHNPTISYLAEYLTAAEIGDMSTAGLVMIRFDISSWREVSQASGKLENYVYPSLLLNQ